MRNAPLLLPAALCLLGCATSAQGPNFAMAAAPSSDVGTLYIYRPANKNSGGDSPGVYVDEEKLFPLQNAGYGVVLLPRGEHEVVVKNLCFPAVSQKVSVRGGEQMFLRFSIPEPLRPAPTESSGHWSMDLVQLPARVAEAEKWQQEWCELTPRFEAIERGAAVDEISRTKLVDGGSAEENMLKQK